MTTNQKIKIDVLIKILPDCDKSIYCDISKYVVELGYSPSKVKDCYEPVVFGKNIKNYGHRNICRISPPNIENDETVTKFAMSFYAASEYSDIFHESVRKACESRKNVSVVTDYSNIYRREHEVLKCNNRRETCDKCRKCKSYYYK
jgi:hypothetical protein